MNIRFKCIVLVEKENITKIIRHTLISQNDRNLSTFPVAWVRSGETNVERLALIL